MVVQCDDPDLPSKKSRCSNAQRWKIKYCQNRVHKWPPLKHVLIAIFGHDMISLSTGPTQFIATPMLAVLRLSGCQCNDEGNISRQCLDSACFFGELSIPTLALLFLIFSSATYPGLKTRASNEQCFLAKYVGCLLQRLFISSLMQESKKNSSGLVVL